jgi:hypothetical protein
MSRVVTYADGTLYIERPKARWGRIRFPDWPIILPPEASNEVLYQSMADSPQQDNTVKGASMRINPAWLHYLDHFHTPAASNWLWTPWMLWINRPFVGDRRGSQLPNADPAPVIECISGGYNIVQVIGETDFHYETFALSTDENPNRYDPAVFNFRHYPWIFWKAQARTRLGELQNVGSGLDVFHIHFRKPADRHYIHKSRLDLFPEPPFSVFDGESFHMIIDYQFDHSRIPLLIATPKEIRYPTTWKEDGRPVIPPKS